MSISVIRIRNQFYQNLIDIKGLYEKTTLDKYDRGIEGNPEITNMDISVEIYNILRKRVSEGKSVLSIVYQYDLDVNKLIDDLNLREKYESKFEFVEYKDYENNREAVEKRLKDTGKTMYFIPYLILYVRGKERSITQNKMMLKMSYIYLHNILDELILDVISYVSYSRIEMFSSKKMDFKDILECESIEEIHKKMVGINVSELGHASFSDKMDFLRKHGIEVKKDLVDDIVLFCEIRNSLTHSKLIVNKTILKKLKSTKYYYDYKVGDCFTIDEESFVSYLKTIDTFGMEILDFISDK